MGETALMGGVTITVVCQPVDALGLAGGGFEQSGQMKALVYGITVPTINTRLTSLRSKTWIVKTVIRSMHSVETALLLEVAPV
jgi:hypothetical protein